MSDTKNVIITGASGNLGKATVEKFTSAGYRVLATFSPGKPLPFPPSAQLETFEVDLRNEKEVEAVIQRIIDKHHTVDAALLLAGGYASGGIGTTDGESLKNMYALNFETAYFVTRPLFLHMQKQKAGGRIVLVGARPALRAADGKRMMAYALSKSLLFKLAEYLNAEGLVQNVVTSVIVPSTIDTPPNRASMPTADFSKWVSPEELATLLEFIASQNGASLREPIYKVYGGS
jgi:NAD(P)-dependent dehydrogenase (short-subunit alcohol dehydrogenase family)